MMSTVMYLPVCHPAVEFDRRPFSITLLPEDSYESNSPGAFGGKGLVLPLRLKGMLNQRGLVARTSR